MIIDIEKSKKNIKRAARSALNKTATKGRTAALKKIRKTYGIKAKDLRKQTKIIRAKNDFLEVALIVKGAKLPLFLFNARQLKKGLFVNVKRGQKVLVKHGFIAKVKGGKKSFLSVLNLADDTRKSTVSIFVRKKKGDKLVARLPIKKLFTVSAADMFLKEGEQEYKSISSEELGKIFKKELEFFNS